MGLWPICSTVGLVNLLLILEKALKIDGIYLTNVIGRVHVIL
jgi:hypothetical protein